MFRLLKSGLPKDPVFPADLKGLGYFIDEDDEVRMINNPRAYFDYFLTKNDRYNAVQREAVHAGLRDEVLARLHAIGLETVRLPLGAEQTEPNVPILVSSKISKKKRVIVLFYEHTQDLGVFAYRIIGGRGGINAGSAVNFVKYVLTLSGPDGEEAPGIILANLGQLRWWRRGKKAVTHVTWFSVPQKSAVSGACRFDPVKNTVPQNRSTTEHVAYIFNHVIPDLLAPDAMLEVIGVSIGAVDVVDFLNKPQNWAIMEPRLIALALVATFHMRDDISNPWFASWLQKRGRAYVTSPLPASTPLAPSDGNPYTNPDDNTTSYIDCYGCPVYSLGEPYYSEMMFPKGYKTVLDWFQEVVVVGESYENPEIMVETAVKEPDENGEDMKREELIDADVTAEGTQNGERINVGLETENAIANNEQSEVGKAALSEPDISELDIQDSHKNHVDHHQKLKNGEQSTHLDWSEDVWEEEQKQKSLSFGSTSNNDDVYSSGDPIPKSEKVAEEFVNKAWIKERECMLEAAVGVEEVEEMHSLPSSPSPFGVS